jgi:rod shape-determining protein MreD
MPRTTLPADKVEIYRFHVVVLILTPLLALVLQTYLPLLIVSANLLDLPLLVVIYFGLMRRSPVQGILTGALVGMAQDGLSRGPIGFLGSAKTVIGYVASFASVRFAVESALVRTIIIFVLFYLHFLQLYLMSALLLGNVMSLDWGQRFVGALVNTGVGVVMFKLLDRFRKLA